MKILLYALGSHPSIGGVQSYIHMITKTLTQRGYFVELLHLGWHQLLPPGISARRDAYKTLKLAEKDDNMVEKYIDFLADQYLHTQILKKFDLSGFDVIHSQSGILSVIIKKMYPNIPLIGTIHSSVYTESIFHGWVNNQEEALYFREFDQWAVDCPTKVITVSKFVDSNLPAIPKGKHLIINHAVESNLYNPKEKRSNGALNIAAIGVFTFQKGYDILLKALTTLKEKNIPFTLTMYGDGPELDNYEQFCKEHSLVVDFKGYVSQQIISEELGQYDVLVQPSRFESFGIAVTEAMSSGCVPVCSNVGGLPEQVEHRDNGFLFDVENDVQLADILIELANNLPLRVEMSKKSRDKVNRLFSIESFAVKMENAYRETIIKHRALGN